VTDVEDHVKLMMAKLDGTVITKTDGSDDEDTPNGHDIGAKASMTADEIVAVLIDCHARFDGDSEPSEIDAAGRALENLERDFGLTKIKASV
jgi:hypothetical protein